MNLEAHQSLRLDAITLPDPARLSIKACLTLRALEIELNGLSERGNLPSSSIDKVLADRLFSFPYGDLLHDELAGYCAGGSRTLSVDSPSEVNAFITCRNGLETAVLSSDGFVDWLVQLHAATYGSTLGLRTTGLGTAPQSFGVPVRYCSPHAIRSALERLRLWLLTRGSDHSGLAAVVALNGIAQIHPFSDGNGRASRVLFNIVAARRAMRPSFIPLKFHLQELNVALAIKLNRARLGGSWEEIILHLLGCAKLAAALDPLGQHSLPISQLCSEITVKEYKDATTIN